MSKELAPRLSRIRAAVSLAADGDPFMRRFGAHAHKYQLNSPLTESAVAKLEAGYAITFPEEFREFIKTVGDGGAGPFLGLNPVAEAMLESEESTFRLAFPHSGPWNMEFTIPRTDPNYPVKFARFENEYFDAAQVAGSLAIAHEGCGHYIRLVLNGPERGNLWQDSRVADGGIFPLEPTSPSAESARNLVKRARWTFLDWYELWLDGNCA